MTSVRDLGPSPEDLERFGDQHQHGWCPQCGAEVWDDAEFCPECGDQIGSFQSDAATRARSGRLAEIF